MSEDTATSRAAAEADGETNQVPQEVGQVVDVALDGVKPKYATLKKRFGDLFGMKPGLVNPKVVSGHNQVSPRASESRNNKFKAGNADEWCFLGIITAPQDDREGIVTALRSEMRGLATVAPFIAKNDGVWQVQEIVYEEGHEEKVERVRAALNASHNTLRSYPRAAGAAVVDPIERPKTPELEEADLFVTEIRRIEFHSLLRDRKALVLQGPPGTGKTIVAKQLATELTDGDLARIETIQMHASYSYEQFVRGWEPFEAGYRLADGAFLRFCDLARSKSEMPHVLIIDEINRANTASVLGEVLSLVEGDKRSERYALTLAYQKEGDGKFFVPANVFVIGTMNTADRSLALVDYALRRRFAFEEIPPAFDSDEFVDFMLRMGVEPAVADTIVERMSELNDQIRRDVRNLGPGFEVGHSYFCPSEPGEYGAEWYATVIRTQVAPLLREYWIDDEDTYDRAVGALDMPI